MGAFSNTWGQGMGHLGTQLNYNWNYLPIIEDRVRTLNRILSFTGTVRTVGAGKTYATYRAAYLAASSGDIIEGYGTLDMKDEPGGYLLLDNATKRILFRGESLDPNATLLHQTAGGSFCVRIETGAELVFQNLSVTRADNIWLFYTGPGYSNIHVFKNCNLSNTKISGNNSCYVLAGGTRETLTKYVEFDSCNLSCTDSDLLPVYIAANGANTQYLFTNCTVSNKTGAVFVADETNTCKIATYDNTFNQVSNNYVLKLGHETTTPAINLGQIDMRGNTFNLLGSAYAHTCLIGRGTTKVYFVNNKLNQSATSQASAGGLTIKTQSAALADAIFKGNKIIAPRTLVLNQSKYCDVSENVIINNHTNWEPILIVNGTNAGEYTRNNSVKNNTVYGISKIIRLDTNAVAETAKVSALTGEITLNKYATGTGHYLNDDGGANIEFSGQAAFWGSDFDKSSWKTGVAQPT